MRLDLIRLRIMLLTVLLLCGQIPALTHELGHDLLAVDDYCHECFTQSVWSAAVVADHQGFPVLEIDALLISPLTSSYSRHNLPTNTARAPPFSS